VKFTIRHAVSVPVARVIAAYGSPEFYEGRPTRDEIAVREVVRHEVTDERVLMEVRFAFTGSISGAARAVVDPHKLSWVTRTEIRPADRCSTWIVQPDHYPDRLTARGTYRFEQGDGPGTTVVEVEGELKVHVPLVGRSVERAIVSDLRAYLDDEVASIGATA
jgi:Protein of unknown function (DUF2505)